MLFHCIGCHQPFKTIYRCVHCPISSQTFATLSDHHHHQQQQQQALLGEKQGQSNYTYLCTNCERKSFFYHFWDHSFVRVWNWSSSEEELTKLIESKKLSQFHTTTTEHSSTICSRCKTPIVHTHYKNVLQDDVNLCGSCFKYSKVLYPEANVWLKIKSLFELNQFETSFSNTNELKEESLLSSSPQILIHKTENKMTRQSKGYEDAATIDSLDPSLITLEKKSFRHKLKAETKNVSDLQTPPQSNSNSNKEKILQRTQSARIFTFQDFEVTESDTTDSEEEHKNTSRGRSFSKPVTPKISRLHRNKNPIRSKFVNSKNTSSQNDSIIESTQKNSSPSSESASPSDIQGKVETIKETSQDKQDVDSERKNMLTSLDQSTYLESKLKDPLNFLRQSDDTFVSFPTKNIYYLNEENLSENEISDRSHSTEKHSDDSSSQNDDFSDNDNDKVSAHSSTSFIKSTMFFSCGDERNWNEEFQAILDWETTNNNNQRFEKLRALSRFTSDFIETASRIGDTIIKEIHLPVLKKTYKPKDFGGVAGGEKYSEEGIFFKLVIDAYGIYGDDQFSFKAAGHELNGLKAYFGAGIKQLHFPFLMLLDYCGYRLIATTKLPISKDTLRYGSGDGGKTVHADDPKLNHLMKLAAKAINIKGHYVASGGNNKVKIYGPIDIEGHKARDGRYYVLDTARVFPPEPPRLNFVGLIIPADKRLPHERWQPLPPMKHVPAFTASKYLQQVESILHEDDEEEEDQEAQTSAIENVYSPPLDQVDFMDGTLFFLNHSKTNIPVNSRASVLAGKVIRGDCILILKGGKCTFLYNLLRHSYVKRRPKPLSSDAFTPFGKYDSEIHRKEVEEAYFELRGTEIPNFVESLKKQCECLIREELIKSIHQFGINIRYIGFVRSLINEQMILKAHLLAEMIIRVTKNYIRSRLRNAKSEESIRRIIVHHFNLLLGNSHASSFFWHFFIKAQIEAKFGQYGQALTEEELSTEYDLRQCINKLCLFQLLQTEVGVRFTQETQTRFLRNPHLFDAKQPLHLQDIETLTIRIKHLLAPELYNQVMQAIIDKCGDDDERARVMLEDFFGPNCKEVAHVYITVAYKLHLQGKYQSVEDYVDKALKVFESDPSKCPLEICVKAFYLRACKAEFDKEDPEIIEAYLRAAYHGFVLLTGTNYEQDNGIYAFELDRPFALLILNKLAILLNKMERFLECWTISAKFIFLWNNFAFPGSVEETKETFGSEIPLPFIFVYERSRLGPIPYLENCFDINALIRSLVTAPTPSDPQKVAAWKNAIHMNGLNYLSGFCLSPKVLDEYIANKQYQKSPYISNEENIKMISSMGRFHCLLGPSIARPRELHEIKVRLLISPSSLKFDPHTTIFIAILRYIDRLLQDGETISTDLIVAKQEFDFNQLSPVVTFKALESLKPGMYQYNIVSFSKSKNEYQIFPSIKGPILHVLPSDFDLQVLTMDVNKHILKGDYHFTNEKVICLDLCQDILVATASGSLYMRGTVGDLRPSKSSSSLSDSRRNAATKQWTKLRTFGSWKVQQVCCSENHQILLTATGEVFSWGRNDHGQLGHGDTVSRTAPRVIERFKRVKIKYVSCGRDRSFAIDDERKLYQWGVDFKYLPELHPFFTKNRIGIVDVACTPSLPPENVPCHEVWRQSICIYVTDIGHVYWYAGKSATIRGELSLISAVKNEIIVKAAVGYTHVLLLNDQGQLFVLGEGDKGQYGSCPLVQQPNVTESNVSAYDSFSPPRFAVPVKSLIGHKIVKIMAAKFHSYALENNGTLWQWGDDLILPRPISLFQSISIRDFSCGPNEVIIVPGIPEDPVIFNPSSRTPRSVSNSSSELLPQQVGTHSMQIDSTSSPVSSGEICHSHSFSSLPGDQDNISSNLSTPLLGCFFQYSTWEQFFMHCGLSVEDAKNYSSQLRTIPFDIQKVKTFDYYILSSLGVSKIEHQMLIMNQIHQLKTQETEQMIERKLTKVLETFFEQHQGILPFSTHSHMNGNHETEPIVESKRQENIEENSTNNNSL